MYRPPLPPFTLEPRASREDLIAVRFAHERHDAGGRWFRSHANESCAFDGEGLTHTRIASINDLATARPERLNHWPAGRHARGGHAGLTERGL